jgi:hypothetical protein
MGVYDLDARFDAVTTSPGTLARTVVGELQELARTINNQVTGEPYQWVTVLQNLETAAHQAATFLDFPPDQQPGDPEPPADPDAYEDMNVDDLRAELARRKEAGRDVTVSGNRPELLARLREDDLAQQQES